MPACPCPAPVIAIDADRLAECLPSFVELLRATVDAGASIGFVAPLAADAAFDYWRGVEAGIRRGERLLLASFDGGEVRGCVQLALEGRPNGRHRAELQKLMVHPSARGAGLGRALMTAAECTSRVHGRTLLVLDTRAGDPAEALYRRLGWTEVGRIAGYTWERDGSRHATVLFCRELGQAEAQPVPC